MNDVTFFKIHVPNLEGFLMADHTSLQCPCCAHHPSPSVHQTLDEMDFERGIWSAALDGDYERVRSFIQRATDPNKQDQAGYTALHYASRAGHHTVCELLLDHGACANSQTRGGTTPLLRAAYCGHLRVVELLLRHRADPGLTDDDGSTPLHKAAERGHVDICKLLVSKCPSLRMVKDRRMRRPADLCSGSSVLSELLKPQL